MNWKQFVNDYFSFTKKERQGIFIIMVVICILLVSINFLPYLLKQEPPDYEDFKKDIALLSVEKSDSINTEQSYKNSYSDHFNNDNYVKSDEGSVKSELFYFDPNTATYQDWQRLGLRDKTIHTIQNYLSKGGKFHKPEDIRKIWGLSSKDAERLMPYAFIRSQPKQSEPAARGNKEYTSSVKDYTPASVSIININTADTSQLISLPGIGSKLSARIIAFRNRLGGFYSVDQVAETYMLPDSTFKKIKPMITVENIPVKQININMAGIDEMKLHPYLRYNLANAIFQYRRQHGNFNSVEDIKKIMLITNDIYGKIAPYLTVK
ncbi:MAG TPA: helix-hairpin-helix domain-containing protein [Chitinophagaceae bacterium]|nr:helix-hairpin-helix domain-containing protein [Chitinophagaceae bacterium]